MSNETIASEVISSSLGGAISASILYPLEVLKTKMQADDSEENKDKNMLEYATDLYQRQGLTVFLSGVETSAFQSAMEKAFYFFAYQALKDLHKSVTGSKNMGTLTNLTLGCAAEWCHLPITLPLDCWTTKIQTDTSGKTALQLLFSMLSDKKTGMYKGIRAYVVLCFKPAIQYTVFEQVKKIMVHNRRKKQLSAPEAFILGMVARTVATIAVFPYLRAKVVLQTTKSDTTESIPQMLKEMFQEGGLKSCYQGLGPELTRGIFSAALMLMIKEKISLGVQSALAGKKLAR